MSKATTPTQSADVTASLAAATAAHQAGDLQSARVKYAQLLKLAPDHAEALYLSGALDCQSGDMAQAIPKLEKSLAVRPDYLPALEMLGTACASTGHIDRATQCFTAVVEHKPSAPDAHYNLGVMHFQATRYHDAAEALQKAAALKPDHDKAIYLLANARRLLGQLKAAADTYSHLVKMHPANARALDEYGGVLFDLGRTTEAERIIESAIAAAPDMANPYTNLGRIYHSNAVHAQKALALHEKAIARAPDYAAAHNNRGVALQLLGRVEEAVASYDKAIALKPTYAEAHRNKGLASLMLGQWETGWRENEWRTRCHDFTSPPRGFTQPTWDGKNDSGKLLVWGEQGVGDEILFGSMVGDLVARGISVVWEADARLVPLIARSYPTVRAVARRTPPDPATQDPAIHAQISTGGLGQHVRRSPSDFPSQPRRYLHADTARAEALRARVTKDGYARVVGVSWMSANERFGTSKTSLLKTWRPLWDTAGAQTCFVDLQYGDTTAERADSGLDLLHLDDVDVFNDIDGLAALIAACDQVVSVSNTTAHLACALNVPTAVIVPCGNGQLWYWGNDGARTPWYPAATLFRQREPGRWDDVLAAVAAHMAPS